MNKSIIEKLGIEPIRKRPTDSGAIVYLKSEVEQLENQRNAMLKLLILSLQLDPFNVAGTLAWQATVIKTIREADPQHRTLEQIKEAISE